MFLDAVVVCRFLNENETYSLLVDSTQRRSVFWLEKKHGDEEAVLSEMVHSWADAVRLLKENDCFAYETDFVDPLFFDDFAAARPSIGRRRKYSAQERILEISRRIQSNEIVTVEGVVKEFNINRATLQRDIKVIRGTLEPYNKRVEYLRSEKGYGLNVDGDYFTIENALIMLMMLYGSRALNKEELKDISYKLTSLFSKTEQIKINEFFRSYLYHYKPVQEKPLLKLFETCFQAISNRRFVKFTYTNGRGEISVQEVIPVTITYHDRKFYLHAKKKDSDQPKAFVIDRIEDCIITVKRFVTSGLPESIGDYIVKSAYMYSGKTVIVRMKVKETNIEFLMRNFPDAEVGPVLEGGWHNVQVEVNGLMGIKLWILQQGQHVEVLEPIDLREQVKLDVLEMHQLYFQPSKV
ncbi:helix-turn-helix transcriptional regulator [Mesobacillus jeotgali]|uniref:helix-turn-helix transcriptional regulator n=1 Tax=Mesobacillus jeotgali TaxID=129985 RepID=UPI0017858522|nr:WYL domain-containing protein [Mesobacillus jeotgali]UYZ21737.1 WYL domain-containing protein [Mesobacillus jeotgali]